MQAFLLSMLTKLKVAAAAQDYGGQAVSPCRKEQTTRTRGRNMSLATDYTYL